MITYVLWERRHKGDLIGLTAAEVRALHFRRDREFLQRDDTPD